MFSTGSVCVCVCVCAVGEENKLLSEAAQAWQKWDCVMQSLTGNGGGYRLGTIWNVWPKIICKTKSRNKTESLVTTGAVMRLLLFCSHYLHEVLSVIRSLMFRCWFLKSWIFENPVFCLEVRWCVLSSGGKTAADASVQQETHQCLFSTANPQIRHAALKRDIPVTKQQLRLFLCSSRVRERNICTDYIWTARSQF